MRKEGLDEVKIQKGGRCIDTSFVGYMFAAHYEETVIRRTRLKFSKLEVASSGHKKRMLQST